MSLYLIIKHTLYVSTCAYIRGNTVLNSTHVTVGTRADKRAGVPDLWLVSPPVAERGAGSGGPLPTALQRPEAGRHEHPQRRSRHPVGADIPHLHIQVMD